MKRICFTQLPLGAAWGLKATRRCRCGQPEVTARHFYWTCPDLLSEDQHGWVRNSQAIIGQIDHESSLRPAECLWARGIMPAVAMADPHVGPQEVEPWHTDAFSDDILREQ